MPGITYWSNFGHGQGYSGSAQQMAIALDRREDTDVRIASFGKGSPKNMSKGLLKIKDKPFMQHDIGFCHGLPVSFSSIQNHKYRVGMTMFEADTLPRGEKWYGKYSSAAESINSQLDLLFTPSSWCVDMFRANGVTIPIEVIPNGINPQHFPYINRPQRPQFTFLMMATLTLRKNPGMVISAFSKLFGDNPDVRLVLKTQSGTLGHLSFVKEMGNIEVIDRGATMNEMYGLMMDADCFVFPSRGEGFGMPPVEAMATGLPTIIANNTGMMDYSDDEFNYTVRHSHKSPAHRFPEAWDVKGYWYEPDYEHLKELMWHVYTHQEEAREKGDKASQWVHENLNYDVIADKMVGHFDALENGEYGTMVESNHEGVKTWLRR